MHSKHMLSRDRAACMLCVHLTQTENFTIQSILPQTYCPPLYLNPPTSFVHKLASCYLPPSGGSLWPEVSPVFSHCWFRLEARILPLARGMSSRLVLIIPPHFNGKPARHASFTNASCRVLSQLFNPWKELADWAMVMF